MKQGGGLISVQLKAKDIATVEVFCNSLKTFLLATSWGGTNHFVSQPAR